MWALPYCLPHTVLLLTVWCQLSTRAIVQWAPVAVVWLLIPFLDYALGSLTTRKELTIEERQRLERRWSFRAIVLIWAPMQLAFVAWCCVRASDESMQLVHMLSMAASSGLIAAGGINVAHELLHRRNPLEVAVGEFLLVSVCYGHFVIEHSLGHHKNVATPLDPASLRFGESFYHFLPRTVFGGLRSAWRIERKRLQAQGLSAWHPQNRVVRYMLSSSAIGCGLATTLGMRALLFFLVQSILAIVLLEQVNAMEHYGLQRKKLANGAFEAIAAQHSWDAGYRLSNYLLFKLQNHADHHLHALRRYQTLRVCEDSPKLPAGYLTLAPFLFVPPLWRKVMDPVLLDFMAARKRAEEDCIVNSSPE